MIITYHREKLINSILYFAKNTDKCGLVKLFKLLFYLDFRHFKQTGRSVTGLEYYAWDYGPVPQKLFNELKNDMQNDLRACITIAPVEQFQRITPKAAAKFNKDFFTPRELKIMADLVYIFKGADAEDMSESTHLPNTPWDITRKIKGAKAHINYLMAIDGTKESLTREEAEETHNTTLAMCEAFGVK